MQLGIAGSASREGSTQTVGIMDASSPDVVKRAMIFWLVAIGLLAAFHVGGSRL